jgi:hypothetical protein
MDKTVHTSASQMMNAAAFGQIIILVVYFPILSLQGIEGKMFKPMAETCKLCDYWCINSFAYIHTNDVSIIPIKEYLSQKNIC